MERRAALIRPLELNVITGEVVDAAMKVHSILGPGLLESVYVSCLVHELQLRGLTVEVEVPVAIVYEGLRIQRAFRIDILVEGAVVVEVKVLKRLHPVHEAKLLSYVTLSGNRVGLLINFHVARLRNGIKRMMSRL